MKNLNISEKNTPLKVVTVVGTRPEIIRLSRVIPLLDRYCDHRLIHTGQNYDYELNGVFFDDLEVRKPDVFLSCAGTTPAATIAEVISKVDCLFDEIQPDAVLILGDTNSSLCALPAKRRKIPIFHMEAGNRSFDLRVPEEINRKVVDHLADVNMPYSDIARQYLIDEGIKPELVVKTGSPMDEVLNYYSRKIDKSNILTELNLEPYQYFTVSMHREENLDSRNNIFKFVELLERISSIYDLPVIVSTHPRTAKKIESLNLRFPKKVKLNKPLAFTDYAKLQILSKVVLSDSGTITEESSILNFPAVNIREIHERPEGMEEGAVMFTGLNSDRVIQAIEILEGQLRGNSRNINKVNDYNAPNVSEKVLRTILSYVDYVNHYTWRK